MELVKSIIILVIGFALLMKGADYFVEGSHQWQNDSTSLP